MLDGRLKTLHPRVFGGILANRTKLDHMQAIAEYNIAPIDLVVVNLYDFLGNPGIETIDIGGPSLIRAAAKNCASVTVLTDPKDYDEVIAHLFATDEVPEEKRVALALKAFEYTALYDAAISKWLRDKIRSGESIFPLNDASH
ncbi:MAG: IMP cyclohydrolase/phosphoribosylaminoimidazolecarboxamide formyltransferase [Parcubacteria group bacterium Gr01-1014_20]|nr:MAG: IMP cyclohydrolase/phosphoribosylaminoimidazolecarboxamide formyltransferase [Parcubacteria group bacterium Gr01-1014_20]